MFFHGSVFSLEGGLFLFRIVVIDIDSVIMGTYNQHVETKFDFRYPLFSMFEFLKHCYCLLVFGRFKSKNTNCTFLAAHYDKPFIFRYAYTSAFWTLQKVVCFWVFGSFHPPISLTFILDQVQWSYCKESSFLYAPASDSGIVWASEDKIVDYIQAPYLIGPWVVGTIVIFHVTDSSAFWPFLFDSVCLNFIDLSSKGAYKHFFIKEIKWSDTWMLAFQMIICQ